MKYDTEKNGIHKIVKYPQEVYCLHYKGKPFSVSKLSYQEQRELGVQYPSIGGISRKCYFSEGNARSGIKNLPKCIRDQVEIVKYIPENYQKAELLLFKNQ